MYIYKKCLDAIFLGISTTSEFVSASITDTLNEEELEMLIILTYDLLDTKYNI